MIGGYTFSTVKLVPQAAGGESINIGMLLCDPARRLLHRRPTGNWGEAGRRAGAAAPPDLGAIL